MIIASSPPLPVGSVGAALAIRHRAPWILDVRDPWPDVAEGLLATVTALSQIGVADRRDGIPRRVAAPLCWLDGPRGRHVVRSPPPTPPSRPPLLVPATGGQLLADIRTVLADAVVPHPPGRSTA